MSRLWLTGYRSYELGIFDPKDPKLAVIKLAIQSNLKSKIDNGTEWVIAGPQLGIEQWGMEVALDLKQDYAQLKLAIMRPFAEFGNQWNATNQEHLSQLITKVDFSDQISDKPYQSPAQLQNFQTFMLTHTDEAMFVYDEEHVGKSQYEYAAAQQFAQTHTYPITMIDFDQLQEWANEYSENKRLEFYEDQ